MPQEIESLKVKVSGLYNKSKELANHRNDKAHLSLAESLQKLTFQAIGLGDYTQAKELCILARIEYIAANEFTSDHAVKAHTLEGVRSMEILLFNKITPKLKKKWWQFWK